MSTTISLANLIPDEKKSTILHICVKVLDKLLGVSEMNRLYQRHNMAGLDKKEFATKLLEILDIKVKGADAFSQKVPHEGPVVIASNHPFGGIEGVILCLVLGNLRQDFKVLANQGLKLFPELSDFFIFTNPLSERDPKNTPSIRAAMRHVKCGGALLIFPAGRVSYFQKNKNRISEHEWNRVVARLVSATNAQYLPVFVDGRNSPTFYRLGRIYFRLRMFMLGRELLNKKGKLIRLFCGNPVPAKLFKKEIGLTKHAEVCRLLSYTQEPSWRCGWPADQCTELKPLSAPIEWQVIEQEINELPNNQHLLDVKDFAVYFGYQQQLPKTVETIARLREWVFREHNEGSGEPIDTDKFDATYTHLFVVNKKEQRIIGAYRMGQTDRLLASGNLESLYLAKMFEFSPNFVNRMEPCLEMGRSFLIPDYQKSFQGLYLLWRGIGAFVCQFPHYRTLYGTVSISKLYDSRSVVLIQHALVKDPKNVTARWAFDAPLQLEIEEFAQNNELADYLPLFLATIEDDGKGIPILAKHYMKLGAKFHCLGIDANFNHTPGLLLSVNLPEAPEKLLKLYLGDGWKDYKQQVCTREK